MSKNYFTELKKSMDYLGRSSKTIFLGQAVTYPGTAMSNTFVDIDKKKMIEVPVAEEMQMGMTIGYILNNFIPVSVFPRFNFLLLSINQLVNHLDKLNIMTKNHYKSKAIIRTSIGSDNPLNPSVQHLGDFTTSIQKMCKNLNIVKLREPNLIFKEYKKALNRKDNVSTILVEYGNYNNTK
tara:strand:- start:574 stop:1116 length:543 start_codon:yes stop_codon:yes gene_type:complete